MPKDPNQLAAFIVSVATKEEKKTISKHSTSKSTEAKNKKAKPKR